MIVFKLFQENKSISWILSQREYIDFSPKYQRMGNVWKKEQKQLLIDSIINGFDIPKLYFHFMPKNELDKKYKYAVIDGKQRLEAIVDFIEDKFPLSKDFKYLCSSPTNIFVDISGKTFSEIDVLEPSVIAKILNYALCIVFLDTDSPDSINETFIRLNSGISVNTAEKRNAMGGNLALETRKMLLESSFFKDKISMNDLRYAHFDLALKLIMLEMGCEDLGKSSVDKFVKLEKDFDKECQAALERVRNKTDNISSYFDDKDPLLSKKNLIITLYAVSEKIPSGHIKLFMDYFEKLRNDSMKSPDKSKSDALMVEFTRQLQQGADKKISIENRIEIMEKYLYKYIIKSNRYVSESDD